MRQITLMFTDVPAGAAVNLYLDGAHSDAAVDLSAGAFRVRCMPENDPLRTLTIGGRAFFFMASAAIDSMTVTLPLSGRDTFVRGRVVLPSDCRLTILTSVESANVFGTSVWMLKTDSSLPAAAGARAEIAPARA